MTIAEHPLLLRFRGRPLLVDANLLLLKWCASFDETLIGSFKRLNTFTKPDIELLDQVLAMFAPVATTPHVLTEVSNLAGSLPLWRKAAWAEHFSIAVRTIEEEWISAVEAANGSMRWLGLTDSALAILAEKYVVLTIDWPLANALESMGLNVINFTHVRSLRLESGD